MDPVSLPPLPAVDDDNLLARLLVDPGTDSELAWALLSKVNLRATVDGKSLLQEFCERRSNGASVSRMPLEAGTRLPAQPGDPWPDPMASAAQSALSQNKSKPPHAAMWVAAALIANDPSPFAWHTEDGRDVLDFAVAWNNDHLFDQLMRKPGAPSPANLSARQFKGKPWLHAMAAEAHSGRIILTAVLPHVQDVDVRNEDRTTALHLAASKENAQLLLEAGADPLAKDAASRLPFRAWVDQAITNNRVYDIEKMFDVWWRSMDIDQQAQARPELGTTMFRLVRHLNLSQAQHMASRAEVSICQCQVQLGTKSMPLLAAIAMEYARSDKRHSSCLRLLEGARLDQLEQATVRQLPQWALLAMVALGHDHTSAKSSYGNRPNGHREIVDRLLQLHQESGCTQEQAHERMLLAMLSVSSGKPFQAKALEQVRSHMLNSLAIQIAGELVGNAPLGPWTRAFVAQPQLWPDLFSDHLNDAPARVLISALPSLAHLAGPGQADQVLVVWMQAAGRKAFQDGDGTSKMTFPAFIEAGERLLEMGARWNPDLPGATDAAAALHGLGRSKPRAGELSASIEAGWLERATPATPAATSRPSRL